MSDATRFVSLLLASPAIHGGKDDVLIVKQTDVYTIRKKGNEWRVYLTSGETFPLREGAETMMLLSLLNMK